MNNGIDSHLNRDSWPPPSIDDDDLLMRINKLLQDPNNSDQGWRKNFPPIGNYPGHGGGISGPGGMPPGGKFDEGDRPRFDYDNIVSEVKQKYKDKTDAAVNGDDYDLSDLEEKLTEIRKWPEFVAEMKKREVTGVGSKNWEDDAAYWNAWIKNALNEKKEEDRKKKRSIVPSPPSDPRHMSPGMSPYWSQGEVEEKAGLRTRPETTNHVIMKPQELLDRAIERLKNMAGDGGAEIPPEMPVDGTFLGDPIPKSDDDFISNLAPRNLPNLPGDPYPRHMESAVGRMRSPDGVMGPPNGYGPMGQQIGEMGPRSGGMRHQNGRMGPPNERMASDYEELGSPDGGMRPPNGMGPMYGEMGPPNGKFGPSYGGMGPSNEGMGPMYGGMGQLNGGVGPMYEGMGPPNGGMGSTYGGMGPPNGRMGPPNEEMGPPDLGMARSYGQMGPPNRQMLPSDGGMDPQNEGMGTMYGGMAPPNRGMGPPIGEMGLPNGGMDPSYGEMRPPPEDMGPKGEIGSLNRGMDPSYVEMGPANRVGPPNEDMSSPDKEMGPPNGEIGPSFGGMGPPNGGMGPSFGGMGPPNGEMGPSFEGMGPPNGEMGPSFEGMGPPNGEMGPSFGGMGPMGPHNGQMGSGDDLPGFDPPFSAKSPSEQFSNFVAPSLQNVPRGGLKSSGMFYPNPQKLQPPSPNPQQLPIGPGFRRPPLHTEWPSRVGLPGYRYDKRPGSEYRNMPGPDTDDENLPPIPDPNWQRDQQMFNRGPMPMVPQWQNNPSQMSNVPPNAGIDDLVKIIAEREANRLSLPQQPPNYRNTNFKVPFANRAAQQKPSPQHVIPQSQPLPGQKKPQNPPLVTQEKSENSSESDISTRTWGKAIKYIPPPPEKMQTRKHSPRIPPPPNYSYTATKNDSVSLLKSLPKVDDFGGPVQWVKFISQETEDGLAKVTDPNTGRNLRVTINGSLYVPVVDHSVARMGVITLPVHTTLAPGLRPAREKSMLRTVLASMNVSKMDERDWLAIESAMGGRFEADQCDGETCQARCHTLGCQSKCMGDTCASGCVADSCTAYCKGPGCLAMCIGRSCTARCDGLACDSRCRGVGCEAKCRQFSCHYTVNALLKIGGGKWEQNYPQYDMRNLRGAAFE